MRIESHPSGKPFRETTHHVGVLRGAQRRENLLILTCEDGRTVWRVSLNASERAMLAEALAEASA